jgi:hypothetical protein
VRFDLVRRLEVENGRIDLGSELGNGNYGHDPLAI